MRCLRVVNILDLMTLVELSMKPLQGMGGVSDNPKCSLHGSTNLTKVMQALLGNQTFLHCRGIFCQVGQQAYC